ncbi:MFS general substrate transporter [Patellaria atrata CBS 101060]|uniref:MFS general substrate transporter n=1 Tax=Patellaria atrata CBS 101060 TaxID=1346257 RepID=A0A9P4SKD1_9PEZI|nr:MFS general substrate transporter [Patellaria atrata CBS 101060]
MVNVDTQESPKAHRKAHANDTSSIPNGGLRAWLQVVGAFVLFFNTWGVVNTFGVYQTIYEREIITLSSPSSISWIGSIQAYLLLFVGALTGPLYDAGYFHELLLTGSFLIVFGHMMVSLCTEYYQILLAQAFCIGVGCGCLFVPSVAILSTYFTTRIATATGIAASGSSLGGVIYPIMLNKLQPQVGFPWAVRIIGFLVLATLLIPNTCMKVRILPPAKRKLIDLSAFRELPFVFFVTGCGIAFMGLYLPFFYMQLYSLVHNITSADLSFYLLPILNASSIFGRIIPNIIADKIGPFNVMIPSTFITGTLALCLIPVRSLGAIIVFALLYGFFSGTFVSVPPAVMFSLTTNRTLIGTRVGMAFSLIGLGVLTGTPIAGAIVDSSGFTSTWIFGGVLILCGGVFMGAARGFLKGWVLKVKA